MHFLETNLKHKHKVSNLNIKQNPKPKLSLVTYSHLYMNLQLQKKVRDLDSVCELSTSWSQHKSELVKINGKDIFYICV